MTLRSIVQWRLGDEQRVTADDSGEAMACLKDNWTPESMALTS
jgi:hypothetical protein